MDNCKHCGKELTHVEGRKKKAFCNVNCRNKYFYASRKKLIELAKQTTSQAAVATINGVTLPNENEFMGVPIPEELSGIKLAVWKNDIKLGKKKK